MKAVGLALLLANLLFLAWSQWLAPGDSATGVSPAPADVPRLLLANEAQQGAGAAAAPAASETAEGQVGALQDQPDAAAPTAGSTPADGSSGQATALPAPASPAPVELLAGVQRCLSIGPFRDLAEATQGSASLRAAGHDPRTRVAEGDVWAGLWVHLAGLSSRSEAQRAVTMLKQNGIRDAYIMPSAGRGADISLGIFSEPARAQRRAEEVRAIGFTPTIAESTRKGTVYWIDVDLGPTDGFIDPAAIPGEEGKITRLKVVACPTPES
jgi:hypothetical protein